jgi:hypothetical protein
MILSGTVSEIRECATVPSIDLLKAWRKRGPPARQSQQSSLDILGFDPTIATPTHMINPDAKNHP